MIERCTPSTHERHRLPDPAIRGVAGARGLPGDPLRSAALLALALVSALALAVHPRTAPRARRAAGDPFLGCSTIGPRCPLSAYTPARAGGDSRDLWVLPPQRQVLPFDLVQAGYPDTPYRLHDVVVRVTCTAYSSTPDQTDSTPFLTASLQPVERGIVALSRDLLRRYTPGAPFDFGDRVELIGVGVFRVEDTMNRRWRRRADIWMPERAEARRWGRRTLLVAAATGGGALGATLSQNSGDAARRAPGLL